MSELTRHGARALDKLNDRVAEGAWLTAEHIDVLGERIDSFALAVDDAIADVEAATNRREMRTACDGRNLHHHFKLVRFQIRTVASADTIDADLVDLQVQLDDVAFALEDAGVAEFDLLVGEVQSLLDNLDVDDLADSVLALVPTDDHDLIESVLDEARNAIEDAHAEIAAIVEAIDGLVALLSEPDPGDHA